MTEKDNGFIKRREGDGRAKTENQRKIVNGLREAVEHAKRNGGGPSGCVDGGTVL